MIGETMEHEPIWHTSYWPMILSFGVLFLVPLSFMGYFVYQSPGMAVVSLGIGLPLTVISIIGWIKESIEDKHGYSEGHSVWAMPVFIASEGIIFAAFFAAYWIMRFSAPSWPPAGTPDKKFIIPVIMTIVLLVSSVTIHISENKMEHNDRGGFLTWLFITILLGLVFLGFSAYEWTDLFHKDFNLKTNIYSTAYYSITGFHGLHVLVGICIFLCILLLLLKGKISKPFVNSAAIYWHFVDIIWLFVVTQVYFW